MFDDFAGVWTPVLASSELPRRRPVGLRIAGAPVVLFRDDGGRPAALVDRCPHRGVALSLGRVEEGRLVCPFHGWAFDGRGASCHVPWNPDARRDRLGATALPARELAGQVWLYTGPRASSEPAVHETFLRDDVRTCGFSMEIDTHWTRAMENMLDWPHLPFVHQRTIGKDLVPRAAAARMDVHLEERPWGFSSSISIDGAPQPGSLDYRFPNLMNLFIPIPKKTLVLQIACVPVGPARARMVMITARDFAKLGLLDRMFSRTNRKIALEDRIVVESSDPPEVPLPREERSVRTDAPTLYFRRRYLSELRGSSASLTSDDEVIKADRLLRRRAAPAESPAAQASSGSRAS